MKDGIGIVALIIGWFIVTVALPAVIILGLVKLGLMLFA